MGSALGSPVKGSVAPPAQSSAPQNTAVGSGCRPGKTKMPIESSAPSNPLTMDRNPPPGWLK